MDTINMKVNGREVTVPAGATIMEAAHIAGVDVPSLCYLKGLNEIGSCRLCLVEAEGARSLCAACVYPVSENMSVWTNTAKVLKARKMTLELILSNHRMECLTCHRNGTCELQILSRQLGISEVPFQKTRPEPEIEDSAAHLVRDNSKCVLCRRCVAACAKQGVSVIGPNDRGFSTSIGCEFNRKLAEVGCISCGQCIVACPTGALYEKDQTDLVWQALSDPSKHVVVGTAPSVRATLGECFDYPIGTDVEGKMVTALRNLGFNAVFDVDTAADFTIIEEGTELLRRLKGEGGPLPLITSCSPGWIRFCEQYCSDFLPNLSSCKSPQGMFGALMKTYYAEKLGLDPKDIFVVSVMPCTAKKYEVLRPNMQEGPYPDIDVSLTTRELASMIKRLGMQFDNLEDGEFDDLFGISTGASVIFGASGGVMEAALRSVVSIVLGGDENSPLEFTEVRGLENTREAVYELPGRTVRVAVTSGTANAAALLDLVRRGEKQYDFIEVMCCPGGCVNGGGQPWQPAKVRSFTNLTALRAAALYRNDAAKQLRRSHLNPIVQQVYADYLGAWGSEKAEEILHTTYQAQDKYRAARNNL